MQSHANKGLSRRKFLAASAAGLSAMAMPQVLIEAVWAAQAKSAVSMPDSMVQAARMLRQGALTCRSLTKACLDCIASLNPRLNAFITITGEQALARAEELDRQLRAGRDLGPLHGIPIVHKDLYDTRGIPTTVGSEFFRSRVPTEDATVVARLSRAGAVCLGKTNMNEFAAGLSGTNKSFGDAHNPWNLERSPGGSSSGTGVAVATGMCLGGTGTDTGGSVRVPASWQGIVGIRPTYGRVSLAGIYPRAYSLDCPGPLARTVGDAALLLNVMAGHDPRDPHSLKAPVPDYTAGLNKGVKGLRIGIIDNYTFRDVDQDVADCLTKAMDVFQKLGAKVQKVSIPLFGGPLEYGALFNILLYEFNKILGKQFMEEPRRAELFGPIVQANIEKGRQISDEVYHKALAERPAQMAQVKKVFQDTDVLLTPVMPTTAPLLSAGAQDYDRGRQFTLPFSYIGLPCMAVPCGFSPQGLPVGLQIAANDLREGLLVQVAAAYEKETGYTGKRPPIYCKSDLG